MRLSTRATGRRLPPGSPWSTSPQLSSRRSDRKAEKLHVSKHKQPHAADRMVNHLRGLPIRDAFDQTGFDAYATIVVDCDNRGPSTLWTAPPAPQPGDRDHYDTFVRRIAEAFARLRL